MTLPLLLTTVQVHQKFATERRKSEPGTDTRVSGGRIQTCRNGAERLELRASVFPLGGPGCVAQLNKKLEDTEMTG